MLDVYTLTEINVILFETIAVLLWFHYAIWETL